MKNIKAIIFDAYGTLFDVNSAAEKCKEKIGDKWESFSSYWRTTQLEYTWLRSLMKKHKDFWKITEDSLNKSMKVYNIELGMKTPFSSDIICALYHRYPGARFVWLMGADNLISFHRWQNWSWIMENIPIGVLPRPGKQIRAGLSLAARRYQRYRLKTHEAKFLSRRRAPAWLLLTGSMIDISSTNIRSDEL